MISTKALIHFIMQCTDLNTSANNSAVNQITEVYRKYNSRNKGFSTEIAIVALAYHVTDITCMCWQANEIVDPRGLLTQSDCINMHVV